MPEFNLSPEEALYLDKMRRYASLEAIDRVNRMSSGDADVILLELEYIEPPSSLALSHRKVISGYEFIREGKLILEKHPRGAEKAEGHFLVSWGVHYLFEFIDDVNALLDSRKGSQRE